MRQHFNLFKGTETSFSRSYRWSRIPHYGTDRFITTITKAFNMNPLNSVYIFITNRAEFTVVEAPINNNKFRL
jgi:hypothetical protein